MSRQGRTRRFGPVAAGARPRAWYARALRLRHLNPGWLLCFVFFEGAIGFGLLLALAELANWWIVLILPASVALLLKANDLVAGAVVRRAALVPEQEQERFRREVLLAVPYGVPDAAGGNDRRHTRRP